MTPVVKKVIAALKNKETDYLWHKYCTYIEFEPGRYFHFKYPNDSVYWSRQSYYLSGPPDPRNWRQLFEEKDIVDVTDGLSCWEIFRLERNKEKKLTRAEDARISRDFEKARAFLMK
jgi:hypothetical protein